MPSVWSSVANAAVFTRVALPEMRRYKYEDALATGTVAVGGTLGILIPPSIALIIYSVLVPQAPVPALFAAGMIPGILAALRAVSTRKVYVCNLRPQVQLSVRACQARHRPETK